MPHNNQTPCGLSHEQRLAWLRLFRCESVGSITFRELLNFYGSAANAIEALPRHNSHVGRGRFINIPSQQEIEREYEQVRKLGGEIFTSADPEFPWLLRATSGAPPLLTVRGNPEMLNTDTVAAVGTRNASAAAMGFCRQVVRSVGENGWTVASGLARGVDTSAHIAALPTGTIAVVAGGIDVVYPPQNKKLYDQIIDTGLVVTEMPLGTQPMSQHFPRRNRIIAGLAQAVMVFEGARRSGSLITARLAAEMGREVWAVPGHPVDMRSGGTNILLRDGANFLISADELVNDLADLRNRLQLHSQTPISKRKTENNPRLPLESFNTYANETTAETNETESGSVHDNSEKELTSTSSAEAGAARIREQLLEMLSTTPTSVDDLIARFDGDSGSVRLVLLEAALADRLSYMPGDMVVATMRQ